MQKGNTALVVVAVVLVLGVLGYYLFSKGTISKYVAPVVTTVTNTVNGVKSTTAPAGSGNITNDKVYLRIFSPADGETVNTTKVTVKGETMMNAEVFVNDKETKGDEDGYFSVDLTLDEGKNDIIVVANDDQGNVSEKDFSVNVQTF